MHLISFSVNINSFSSKIIIRLVCSLLSGGRFLLGSLYFRELQGVSYNKQLSGHCYFWGFSGPRKWEKDLKTGNIDWKTKFKNIGKICCENRLREFNFKLLHRLTVTQKELRIYGVNNENRCPYCKEPDSILHTFVECHYTQTFYAKVVDWFNAKFNSSFSPTSQEKLFGTDLTTSRNNELKLNYCLLFAKYYLYYQKLYHKDCNITEFVLKLEQKLLIESCLKRNILV